MPRTVGRDEADTVGQDAKIPLPTIYLSIKRLASIGEADEKEVNSQKMSMDPLDAQLMADFVASVILGCKVTTEITHQSIKGSKKKTAQPGYESHHALAISMGHPDFVVETHTERFVVELKREDWKADENVRRKAKAAALWCQHASTLVEAKPFSYLLIPHQGFGPQYASATLQAQYVVKR